MMHQCVAAIVLAMSALPLAADPIVSRLQGKIDRLESLRGRFVQTLESTSLGRTRTERGNFAVKKPGFMRWEYLKPERKIAITDGRETWLYLPEEREAHRGILPEDGGSAGVRILSGGLRLDRDFNVRELSGEELRAAGPQGIPGAVVLELIPLQPAGEFERMILAADPKLLLIRRLTLVDAMGERMVLDFHDIDENPSFPEGFFRFEVPEGVEVLDER